MRISIEGVVSQLMNQGFKSAVGRRRGADLTPKCKGSNPLHLQRVTYEGRSKPRGTATFRRYELVSVCGIWQWRRHSCLLSPPAFFGVSFLVPYWVQLSPEARARHGRGRGITHPVMCPGKPRAQRARRYYRAPAHVEAGAQFAPRVGAGARIVGECKTEDGFQSGVGDCRKAINLVRSSADASPRGQPHRVSR